MDAIIASKLLNLLVAKASNPMLTLQKMLSSSETKLKNLSGYKLAINLFDRWERSGLDLHLLNAFETINYHRRSHRDS